MKKPKTHILARGPNRPCVTLCGRETGRFLSIPFGARLASSRHATCRSCRRRFRLGRR